MGLYYDTPELKTRIPREGPRTAPIVVPFSQGVSFDVSMLLTRRQGYLSLVSTLFVDNSDNAQFVDFITGVINQRLRIPAFSQAYMPLLVPQDGLITCQSTGGVDIMVDFINVQIPALIWSATTPPPPTRSNRIISAANYRIISAGNFRTIN